jgi:proline iminopeptidase
MDTDMMLFNEGFLKVDDIYSLKFWEWGNPEGIPIISLHGGPGSKSSFKHIKQLNFKKFRIIQFDQRGAGESTPSGDIKKNTTQDLIEDIEKLREYLHLDKLVIKGGSWGSTLSLLYAERYSENLLAILLSSVFLAREEDYEWIEDSAVERIVPERKDILEKFSKKYSFDKNKAFEILLSSDFNPEAEKSKMAALFYFIIEGLLIGFDPLEFNYSIDAITDEDVFSARIAAHYAKNNFFIKENQILNNVSKIKKIPTFIGHSRYDLVCPYDQAYILDQTLENSFLYTYTNYSHGGGASVGQAQNNFLEILLKI